MSAFTNETKRKRIHDCMIEISNSMTRVEAERDFVKDAVNSICDELQLDKKIFRRMVKVYHKQSFADEVVKDSEFQELYDVVTTGNRNKEENGQ